MRFIEKQINKFSCISEVLTRSLAVSVNALSTLFFFSSSITELSISGIGIKQRFKKIGILLVALIYGLLANSPDGQAQIIPNKANESLSAGAKTLTSLSLLPERLQYISKAHGLSSESLGFSVQALDSEENLLSFNDTVSFNPASSIKLLTTLVALEELGPAHKWQTRLYARGDISNGILRGDLLLQGGGDPYLTEEKLRAMLKALQREGVKEISGKLLLDGSFFDPTLAETPIIDQEVGRVYNTRPSAFITNFQSVTFYFYPHGNGRDVIVVSDPFLGNMKIDNRLRQIDGACSGYQRGINFSVNESSQTVIFSGRFPSGCSSYAMTREVLDSAAYTFGLFRQLWKELGGTLEGGYSLANVNELPQEGEKPLLTWDSEPLSDLIKLQNKFSNNLMTRHLLLILSKDQPATVKQGTERVKSWLLSILPITTSPNTSSLRLINGAGLSRETGITPELMQAVLRAGWQSRFMPEFLTSMPINGIDGTMRNRITSSSLVGKMHIKTGSLDEVAAVAGYVRSTTGRYFSVVGFVNHPLADRGPGKEILDALLEWVALQ